jgi:nucleolin
MSRHKGKPGSDSDDDSRESLRGAENASTSDDDSENSDSDKSNPTDTESGSSVASDSSSSSDEGAGTPIIGKKKKEVDSDSDSDSDSEEDDVSKLRGLELFDDEEGFGISTGSRRRSSVSMRISHKRRAVLEEKAGLMDENAKDALKLDEDRYSDSSDSSFEIPDSEDDDDSDSESGGNDDDVDGEDGIGDHEKTGKKKLEGTGEKVKAGKADFAAKREARFVRILFYVLPSFSSLCLYLIHLFLFVCIL